jgi:hypothetical protein
MIGFDQVVAAVGFFKAAQQQAVSVEGVRNFDRSLIASFSASRFSVSTHWLSPQSYLAPNAWGTLPLCHPFNTPPNRLNRTQTMYRPSLRDIAVCEG